MRFEYPQLFDYHNAPVPRDDPEWLECCLAAHLTRGDTGIVNEIVIALNNADPGRAVLAVRAMQLGVTFAENEQARRARQAPDPASVFLGESGWEVDFDGVLHTYHLGWHDGTVYGPAVPGAMMALWAMRQRAAAHVTTARPDLQSVAVWLARRGVPTILDTDAEITHQGVLDVYGIRRLDHRPRFWTNRDRVLVTNRKLPALAYIDDRAIRHVSWAQALHEVELAAETVP